MTRTFSTTASWSVVVAVFSLALAPAAEACISCNYTPEVAQSPSKPKPTKRAERPSQKRVVKAPRSKDIDTARETETSKPTEEARTGTVEGQADTLTSEASTAALADPDAKSADEPKANEPKSGGPIGCKKFNATLGTTVTVPCD